MKRLGEAQVLQGNIESNLWSSQVSFAWLDLNNLGGSGGCSIQVPVGFGKGGGGDYPQTDVQHLRSITYPH